MGNTTGRKLPLYTSLCKKDSQTKMANNKQKDDSGDDDVFEADSKKSSCCPWSRRSSKIQGRRADDNHRVHIVLSFLYGATMVGGAFVVALVPLVQLFKSPRKWCTDPMRTQDSSAEYCWLDLVHRTFPLTLTDVITFCAGLASFILGCLWFCCKSWRGRRHLNVVSVLLVIVFLTEVITSVVISVLYSQRQEYLPIELRKSIKQELYKSVRQYDSDEHIKETWDLVHKSWCCCGVMEAVDWRNNGKSKKIPRSCAVMNRNGNGYTCFGFPWSHTIRVDFPKYFDEEGFHTTSRGCFESFAKRVGRDYVEAINVGWKVLLALSFLQIFGIVAPVVQACWIQPTAADRDLTLSRATEMTSARSLSNDSALSQNNRLNRQISRQPLVGGQAANNGAQRQDSQLPPTAPPASSKSDQGIVAIC